MGSPRRLAASWGLACAAAVLPAVVSAQQSGGIYDNIDITGQIAIESRWFPENPAFRGQVDGVQYSGFFEPKFRWQSEDRNDRLTFVPFVRLDAADDERTHFDIREANWRRIAGDWDFLIGVDRVFWGVTESRHLINIINQIDAVENIDEEDFLGQPMVQVGRQTEFGRFDLFVMTGFRERTFAGADGRLRGPLSVDTDDAEYTSSLEQWRPDIALRYTHYIGDVDIGLSIFHGTGREPDLRLSADGRLIPRYKVITQVGADLQYTTEAWLWKFEGLVREGQGDFFAAAVAGVEYTLYQIAATGADLGLLAEALYDGRDDEVFPTILDRDVFLGARLTLNDIQDTALLAGLIADVDDGLGSIRLEVERRVGESWKMEVEVQAFLESEADNTASLFEKDSFVTLRISRYF